MPGFGLTPRALTRPRRHLAQTTVIAALAVLTVSSASAQQQPADATKFRNPLLAEELADPAVTNFGNDLYVYGTGRASVDEKAGNDLYIPMSMANGTDLRVWSAPRGVLKLPGWAQGGTWAPHVVLNPDQGDATKKYVMFFSAKAKVDPDDGIKDGVNCLGVAFAASPTGPFVSKQVAGKDAPLSVAECQKADGNIDPYFLVDSRTGGTGKRWLYWGSQSKPLKRQEVGADMATLVGTKEQLRNYVSGASGATELMNGTPPNDDKDQYTDLLEGSWVIYHAPYYYLFTSGAHCCKPTEYPKGYAVEVWRAPDLKTGTAWERYPGEPDGTILRTADGDNYKWDAPGHNSTFEDGKGDLWIMYHARLKGKSKRQLMMDKISWVDGWPRVITDTGSDFPSSGDMPAPAPLRTGTTR